MRHFIATVLVGLTLVACSHRQRGGLVGFEGTIQFHNVEGPGKESDFTVTTKDGWLRIDLPPVSGRHASDVTLGHVVYEGATNRARLFFDTTKEYRDMDLSKRIATEAPTDPTKWLTKQGTKVVAGYTCTVWSLKADDGGRTDACLVPGLAYLEIFHVKLGPQGLESPLAREYREHSTFPLEVVELDATGKERGRMQVTKVSPASVQDAVFELPPGYVKVDPHFAPPDTSAQGKHPHGP